eukprot:scaffold120975_cov66-Phaeocystis_antarctica.AAC.7
MHAAAAHDEAIDRVVHATPVHRRGLRVHKVLQRRKVHPVARHGQPYECGVGRAHGEEANK